MKTARIKNKLLQMMYRPGKSSILSSISSKSLDEMSKFLDDEIPSLSGRKRGKSKSDDKKEAED